MSAFNCHITGIIDFIVNLKKKKNPLTSSIAIIDAAVIVVRGCLLQLIVCRGFYFVGGGGGDSFYPIANEVAKGYTCSNATFRSSVCPPVTSLYFDKKNYLIQF